MRKIAALPIALALGCIAATALAQSPQQTYKAVGATASTPMATIAYGRDPLQVATCACQAAGARSPSRSSSMAGAGARASITARASPGSPMR